LNLPPIPNENRRDEAQLYADFDSQLPQILGALFTAASATLARLGQTKLDGMPRMADFALWATAAESALGFQPGAFMDAYGGNRAEAVHETLEADPVGAALFGLMEQEKGYWEGNCSELLKRLEQDVEEGVRKSLAWPKSPRGLSSRLRRLVTFLRELGILIVFHPRSPKGRLVTITKGKGYSTVATVTTVTPLPGGSSCQSVTPDAPDDGLDSKMTEEAAREGQPSQEPAVGNSLEMGEDQPKMSVMTVVTVDSRSPLRPAHGIENGRVA